MAALNRILPRDSFSDDSPPPSIERKSDSDSILDQIVNAAPEKAIDIPLIENAISNLKSAISSLRLGPREIMHKNFMEAHLSYLNEQHDLSLLSYVLETTLLELQAKNSNARAIFKAIEGSLDETQREFQENNLKKSENLASKLERTSLLFQSDEVNYKILQCTPRELKKSSLDKATQKTVFYNSLWSLFHRINVKKEACKQLNTKLHAQGTGLPIDKPKELQETLFDHIDKVTLTLARKMPAPKGLSEKQNHVRPVLPELYHLEDDLREILEEFASEAGIWKLSVTKALVQVFIDNFFALQKEIQEFFPEINRCFLEGIQNEQNQIVKNQTEVIVKLGESIDPDLSDLESTLKMCKNYFDNIDRYQKHALPLIQSMSARHHFLTHFFLFLDSMSDECINELMKIKQTSTMTSFYEKTQNFLYKKIEEIDGFAPIPDDADYKIALKILHLNTPFFTTYLPALLDISGPLCRCQKAIEPLLNDVARQKKELARQKSCENRVRTIQITPETLPAATKFAPITPPAIRSPSPEPLISPINELIQTMLEKISDLENLLTNEQAKRAFKCFKTHHRSVCILLKELQNGEALFNKQTFYQTSIDAVSEAALMLEQLLCSCISEEGDLSEDEYKIQCKKHDLLELHDNLQNLGVIINDPIHPTLSNLNKGEIRARYPSKLRGDYNPESVSSVLQEAYSFLINEENDPKSLPSDVFQVLSNALLASSKLIATFTGIAFEITEQLENIKSQLTTIDIPNAMQLDTYNACSDIADRLGCNNLITIQDTLDRITCMESVPLENSDKLDLVFSTQLKTIQYLLEEIFSQIAWNLDIDSSLYNHDMFELLSAIMNDNMPKLTETEIEFLKSGPSVRFNSRYSDHISSTTDALTSLIISIRGLSRGVFQRNSNRGEQPLSSRALTVQSRASSTLSNPSPHAISTTPIPSPLFNRDLSSRLSDRSTLSSSITPTPNSFTPILSSNPTENRSLITHIELSTEIVPAQMSLIHSILSKILDSAQQSTTSESPL